MPPRRRSWVLIVSALDKTSRHCFWQAGITAEQGRPSRSLFRALVALRNRCLAVPTSRKYRCHRQALAPMTSAQAQALVINADENVLQGWLDRQQMWFNNRSDPKDA